jgi:HK97 family phage portal protein
MIKLNLSPPERRSNPNTLNNPSVPLGTRAIWGWLDGGHESSAGELVTRHTAVHSATVNACVRLLSNSIASMSPILYQRVGAGRAEAFNNPLHDILALEPNSDSTAYSLWSAFVSSIALTGNGYLEIQRNEDKDATALWFLNPHEVTPVRLPDASLAYRTVEGMAAGASRVLKATDVIHCPWGSQDGVTGHSIISQARQTIGTDLAMDAYQGKFYRNNATPSGIITVPVDKKVKPEDKIQMRQDWEELQGGSNQRRVGILDGGMTFSPLSISQVDSAYLASKNYSRQEICGLFGILPSQIGDTARVAGETFAAQQLTFLVDCLRPWLNLIQQELHRKLIPKFSGLTIEHDISDRLRVDFATQMQGFATAKQWGWINSNQILAKLGENGIGPVGDVFLTPANMMNADRLLDSAPPAPTIKPTDTGEQNV